MSNEQDKPTHLSLLRYESDHTTSAVQAHRTGAKGKIAALEPRPQLVRRVDAALEIRLVKLAVAQMTPAEWECWIAGQEGVLFTSCRVKRQRPSYVWHGRNLMRSWMVIPPPAKHATVEQIAEHYGYTTASITRMEREARKLYRAIRHDAGLSGDLPLVPVWAALLADAELISLLSDNRRGL